MARPSSPFYSPGRPAKCTQDRSSPTSPHAPIPSIEALLQLPEDVVWSLRKKDLREYFFALQRYALHPHPLEPLFPTTCEKQAPTPCPETSGLLHLPLEIRQLIYGFLLDPPSSFAVKGPHPRQLQTNMFLSQSFPPALLLLNHQIRDEALPMMYGGTKQTIFISIDYNIWFHKTQRSDLVLSSTLTSAIRHLHLNISLGSEKRTNRPSDWEAQARITEVKKGIKKLKKLLLGANLQTLAISWKEPAQTFSWEQKRDVLDELRPLRALVVAAGDINWGLDWNKGKKYRFEIKYLKELERSRNHAIPELQLPLKSLTI